jgi:hypothetical protein
VGGDESGMSGGENGRVRGHRLGVLRGCQERCKLLRCGRSVRKQMGRRGCGLGGGFWRGCRMIWK